jgi:Phage tail tube protein, GTA-gp10
MTNSPCGRRMKWAGGEHDFDLGNERALRILTGADSSSMRYSLTYGSGLQNEGPLPGQYGTTPAACLKRFQESIYSIGDVEHIIRIGLYGGGLDLIEADDLVQKHVHGQPIGPCATLAFEVLAGLFVGVTNSEDA